LASAEKDPIFSTTVFIFRNAWCDRPRAQIVVSMHAETIFE
jgi:hypothetical protein